MLEVGIFVDINFNEFSVCSSAKRNQICNAPASFRRARPQLQRPKMQQGSWEGAVPAARKLFQALKEFSDFGWSRAACMLSP